MTNSGKDCAVTMASNSNLQAPQSVYVYPSKGTHQTGNPYISNLKKALSIKFKVFELDGTLHKTPRSLHLLRISCQRSIDIYWLNWIEDVGKLRAGGIQFLLTMLALTIVKCRKKKIVWTFHNLNPHGGADWYSAFLKKWLLKYATLIITHSRYAERVAAAAATDKVVYLCHPVNDFEGICIPPCNERIDVFIWGTILPYKGILEFLQYNASVTSQLRIRIIGKCKDKRLDSEISKFRSRYVFYENRSASFEEVASYCRAARYVLFPYIGSCVSSSGALIDTIALGGTPLGPCVGAFEDLEKEGVCRTYRTYEELMLIVRSAKIEIDASVFCKRNGWENYANTVFGILTDVNKN